MHPNEKNMKKVTLYFEGDDDKRRFMQEILKTHYVRWDGGAEEDFDKQDEYEIVYWEY